MNNFLGWLGAAFFVFLIAGSQWLAYDYSEQKKQFVKDCESKGGHPVTPRPGGGEWACLKKEDLL